MTTTTASTVKSTEQTPPPTAKDPSNTTDTDPSDTVDTDLSARGGVNGSNAARDSVDELSNEDEDNSM